MSGGKGRELNWVNRGIEFTAKDYDRMLAEQDGKCAICKDVLALEPKMPPLDHCHATGVVRGILCQLCNNLLGLARDDVSILLSASQYLVERGGDSS